MPSCGGGHKKYQQSVYIYGYLSVSFCCWQAIKVANEKVQQEYGFCIIDGHKQKIGNFKIEPPGLFRGRGDHPKQGMLKRRVMPEDVIINCSKYVTLSMFCFTFGTVDLFEGMETVQEAPFMRILVSSH